MVYSLLSMLGTHDKDDMSRTLLAMSSSQDSCIAMRQSGNCLHHHDHLACPINKPLTGRVCLKKVMVLTALCISMLWYQRDCQFLLSNGFRFAYMHSYRTFNLATRYSLFQNCYEYHTIRPNTKYQPSIPAHLLNSFMCRC